MVKKKSLRSIIIRNYTILAIVPILLFGGVGITTTLTFIREESHQKKLLLARALSSEIDQYFENGIAVLRHVAAVTEHTGHTGEIQIHLDATLQYFESFSSIEIIGKDGHIKYISPYNRQLIGNDVSRQTYFRPDIPDNGYTISDPFISPYTQSPTVAAAIQYAGMLYVGFLDLSFLQNITEKFTIGSTGYAAVFDKNGYILAHPDRSYVAQRYHLDGHAILREAVQNDEINAPFMFQGTPLHATIIRDSDTGWFLVIAQERREADAPVRNNGIIFAVILGIAILVAVFLGIENRRKIIRPVSSLIRSADLIAAGNYDISLDNSEYIEINTLISAMKSMNETIRRRQEALRRSTEQYRNLIEHAGSIIMRWNTDLEYTFLNSYAREIFEFSEEELIGRKLIGTTHREVTLEGKDTRTLLLDIFRDPESYRLNENEIHTKSGKIRWIQWSNKPIYDESGRIREMLSIGTDRTEYKAAEEKINESLKEKEILLKEIHHRVKNNMQIISSLLNLQAGMMHDSRDIELLKTSQNRVLSMSLIHEQLYGSENLAEIDFQEYIRELISYISDTYLSSDSNIIFNIDGTSVYLSIDKAIPLALIVNELISNSVKYAFGENPENGRVDISLKKRDKYELTVRDNGKGLPGDFDPKAPTGLGYQLITALIDQVQGEVSVASNGGTVVTITFV